MFNVCNTSSTLSATTASIYVAEGAGELTFIFWSLFLVMIYVASVRAFSESDIQIIKSKKRLED
jgi:hypothetical protein